MNPKYFTFLKFKDEPININTNDITDKEESNFMRKAENEENFELSEEKQNDNEIIKILKEKSQKFLRILDENIYNFMSTNNQFMTIVNSL